MNKLLHDIRRKWFAVAFVKSRIGIYDDGVFYGRFYSWYDIVDIRGGYYPAFRTGLPVDRLRLETKRGTVSIAMAWFKWQPMGEALMKTAAWKQYGNDAAYGEMMVEYLGQLKEAAFIARYQHGG